MRASAANSAPITDANGTIDAQVTSSQGAGKAETQFRMTKPQNAVGDGSSDGAVHS